MKTYIENPFKDLFLVDLVQASFPGFRNFISSWIYRGPETNFVVDPGPSNTIQILIDGLKSLGIKRLDYILLTHIHLDHGGGTGDLLQEYPMAKVICHEKGISHMINPERLYHSSLEVLGTLARTFGPLMPVREECIYSASNIIIPEGKITIFPTPGHAPHHQSFLFKGLLFCGEALGTTIPTDRKLYLRLATPPVFKHEIFRDSIDRIEAINPDHLCMAHYGFKRNADEVIIAAKTQLEYWQKELSTILKTNDTIPDHLDIFRYLIKNDPLLSGFFDLPEDIKQREYFFSGNSIKGMIDYLKKEF